MLWAVPEAHARARVPFGRLLVPVPLLAALCQPLSGVVFVLDGVLIGAGDGRYLAWAGAAVLLVFAPATLIAVTPSSVVFCT